MDPIPEEFKKTYFLFLEYNKNKRILRAIMNNAIKKIKKNEKKTILTYGQVKSGKSTIAYEYLGVGFKGVCNVIPGTISFSDPIGSFKYEDVSVIDGVGCKPSLSSFSRLIIILMHRKMYPDFILLPVPNNIANELNPLQQLIKLGLIKVLVVPFSANSYFTNLNIKQFGTTNEQLVKKAIECSFHVEIAEKIKEYILYTDSTGHVVTVDSFNILPTINGSMKSAFMLTFFDSNDEFMDLPFEKYISDLTKIGELSTIAQLYGLLLDSVKEITLYGKINNETNLIESLDEIGFLNGKDK